MHGVNLHTNHSQTCSIACPLHITPRSDSVLIDVSVGRNVIRGVAGFSHVTVTNNEILSPTSDVIKFHAVDNVWIDVGQVQGKWRLPSEYASISNEVCNSL